MFNEFDTIKFDGYHLPDAIEKLYDTEDAYEFDVELMLEKEDALDEIRRNAYYCSFLQNFMKGEFVAAKEKLGCIDLKVFKKGMPLSWMSQIIKHGGKAHIEDKTQDKARWGVITQLIEGIFCDEPIFCDELKDIMQQCVKLQG